MNWQINCMSYKIIYKQHKQYSFQFIVKFALKYIMFRQRTLQNLNSYVFLISLTLIVTTLALPKFKTYAQNTIYTGEGLANVVKISDDQNNMMVGYANGKAKIYSFEGSYYCTCYSHTFPIIDIEYLPNVGYITLDSNGTAIRWSQSCAAQYTWRLQTPVYDMSVTSYAGYSYVAFNFGNFVIEYYANTLSDYQVRTYLPQSAFVKFNKIQYGEEHKFLYCSTNTSVIQEYSCSTGNVTFQSFNSQYQTLAFDTTPNGYVVFLNYFYINKFKNITNVTQTTFSSSANLMAATYTNQTFVFVLANSTGYNSSSLYVHYGDGSLAQTLNYTTSTIKAIDVTTNKLCLVDSYGYLYISSYSNQQVITNFPSWLIGFIIGVIVLFCLVGIIMKVVGNRKKRQAEITGKYNRINNQPVVPGPILTPIYPNNHHFNPNIITNPNYNRGYKPSPIYQPIYSQQAAQPWMGNESPHPGYYNPQNNQRNPYQSNQPSNWQ